jgi:hypothetical protein
MGYFHIRDSSYHFKKLGIGFELEKGNQGLIQLRAGLGGIFNVGANAHGFPFSKTYGLILPKGFTSGQ